MMSRFRTAFLSQPWARVLASVLLLALASCSGRVDPVDPQPNPAPPSDSDGSQAGFAQGITFVFNEIVVSDPASCPDRTQDGAPDCGINRAWAPLRSSIDSTIAANINGGQTLLAGVISGLEEPYLGDDPAVTLRLYNCVDIDTDPTNNFCATEGCGQVLAKEAYLIDGDTAYRSQPVPIVDQVIKTALSGDIVLNFGDVDMPLTEVVIRFTLPQNLGEIRDGQICGMSNSRQLNQVEIPVCQWLPLLCTDPNMPQTLSATEFLVLFGSQPEIDVDGDGLEKIELDDRAQIARCIDGDDRVVEGEGCLMDPSFVDGYVLCLDFHGLPGEIVGITEP